MKIRLVGGPLSGKVINDNAGRESLIVAGAKKMSRKALSDWMFKASGNTYLAGVPANRMYRPSVTAEYRKAYVTVIESGVINGPIAREIPCVHPDGSYFYNYVRTVRDDTKLP
jgi:hypothetical protein